MFYINQKRNTEKRNKGFTRKLNLAWLPSVFSILKSKLYLLKKTEIKGYNLFSNKNTKPKLVSGFTLVELMVAVSLFATVMTISMGSIMSVFDANKKSQSLRTVMDNLNFTLEAMTRTIRFGSVYHCDITSTPITSPRDCASGANSLSVLASDGSRVIYKLSNNRIARSIDGGADYYLTSLDMTITDLSFRVFGSPVYGNGADKYQPQVIVVISGYAGSKPSVKSSFTVQTTISQRTFDFQ